MSSWTATFEVPADAESRERLDEWGDALRAAGGTLNSESADSAGVATVIVDAPDLAAALSAAARLVEGIFEREPALRHIAATTDIGNAKSGSPDDGEPLVGALPDS